MTKKTFELTASKAVRVQAVKLSGKEYVSLRQLYKTKKDTDWQFGKQGITIPRENAELIAARIAKFASSDETVFEAIGDEK